MSKNGYLGYYIAISSGTQAQCSGFHPMKKTRRLPSGAETGPKSIGFKGAGYQTAALGRSEPFPLRPEKSVYIGKRTWGNRQQGARG